MMLQTEQLLLPKINYSKQYSYFYSYTKTLAKFGYLMIRKRVNGTMTYFIEKIQK